ncbi:hypothetical protein ACP70R_018179 [Stipagrostis hirtigluma subsp. patula]
MSSKRSSSASHRTTTRNTPAPRSSASSGAASPPAATSAADSASSTERRPPPPPPPMLGFVCNRSGVCVGDAGTAQFVPVSAFRSPLACGRGWRALDSRHGRVLLGDFSREHGPAKNCLLVWDPIRCEQLVLPSLPRHLETLPWSNWNTAVLCASAPGSCNHIDCRRGPFLVPFVGANEDFVFARVYSSEAGEWSEPTFLFRRVNLDSLVCSALVGNAVYFKLESAGILKYDLGTKEISLIDLPFYENYGQRFALMTMEDSSELGLGVMHGSRLHIWSRKAGPTETQDGHTEPLSSRSCFLLMPSPSHLIWLALMALESSLC